MAELLLLILVAWVVLYSILRQLQVRNLECSPLHVLYRSGRFLRFLEKLSRPKKFWSVVSDVSVGLFFLVMGYGVYFMASNLLSFYERPAEASRLVPVLPGITIGFDIFLLMVPSILIVIFSHEAAHAVAAKVSGIKLKSAGFFVAFIFPGAFVEADEGSLSKASKRSKLRFFSAGSSANIVLALLILVPLISNAVFYALISPFYGARSGVQVLDVINGYPAYGVLERGDVILGVNGTRVHNLDEFRQVMERARPRSAVTLSVLRDGTLNNVTIFTRNESGRAVIGVYLFDYYPPRLPVFPIDGPYEFYRFLVVSFIVASSVAIINALPIPPLDGDKVVASLISGKKGALVRATLAASCVTLLLWNIILSLVT